MSLISFDITGFPAEYTIHFFCDGKTGCLKTDALNLGNVVAMLATDIKNEYSAMPKVEIHGNQYQGYEFADDIRTNLFLTYGLKDIEIEVI